MDKHHIYYAYKETETSKWEFVVLNGVSLPERATLADHDSIKVFAEKHIKEKHISDYQYELITYGLSGEPSTENKMY